MKLILTEEGSEIAEKLWDGADQAYTCRVAYPEARAALAAAWRDERLSTRDHVQAIEELDGLIRELAIVELGEPIAQHAGDLADRFGLRGYDAVHLAAALALTTGSRHPRSDPNRPLLAAWDRRLASAGLKAGFLVVPVPPLVEK